MTPTATTPSHKTEAAEVSSGAGAGGWLSSPIVLVDTSVQAFSILLLYRSEVINLVQPDSKLSHQVVHFQPFWVHCRLVVCCCALTTLASQKIDQNAIIVRKDQEELEQERASSCTTVQRPLLGQVQAQQSRQNQRGRIRNSSEEKRHDGAFRFPLQLMNILTGKIFRTAKYECNGNQPCLHLCHQKLGP